jgi:hypothetical protein
MLEVKFGYPFGRDGLVAWDENSCLSAVMVLRQSAYLSFFDFYLSRVLL